MASETYIDSSVVQGILMYQSCTVFVCTPCRWVYIWKRELYIPSWIEAPVTRRSRRPGNDILRLDSVCDKVLTWEFTTLYIPLIYEIIKPDSSVLVVKGHNCQLLVGSYFILIAIRGQFVYFSIRIKDSSVKGCFCRFYQGLNPWFLGSIRRKNW